MNEDLRKNWKYVSSMLNPNFPPTRTQFFCFVYVYMKKKIPQENIGEFLITAYDMFRDIICDDGYVNILEFATGVMGSGCDELMNVLYQWSQKSDNKYLHIPSKLEGSSFDFEFVWNLIK